MSSPKFTFKKTTICHLAYSIGIYHSIQNCNPYIVIFILSPGSCQETAPLEVIHRLLSTSYNPTLNNLNYPFKGYLFGLLFAGVNLVFCLRVFVCLCLLFIRLSCFYILLSSLRFQHAPQQQQLFNDSRRNDSRRGCGKTRNNEEVGPQHLQGLPYLHAV